MEITHREWLKAVSLGDKILNLNLILILELVNMPARSIILVVHWLFKPCYGELFSWIPEPEMAFVLKCPHWPGDKRSERWGSAGGLIGISIFKYHHTSLSLCQALIFPIHFSNYCHPVFRGAQSLTRIWLLYLSFAVAGWKNYSHN